MLTILTSSKLKLKQTKNSDLKTLIRKLNSRIILLRSDKNNLNSLFYFCPQIRYDNIMTRKYINLYLNWKILLQIAIVHETDILWVLVKLLVMCRGELSAVIAQPMSKCLWSGWKWQWGVKKCPSPSPAVLWFVNVRERKPR